MSRQKTLYNWRARSAHREEVVVMTRLVMFALLAIAVTAGLHAQSTTPAKPARINRAIGMLEQGQPVYYTQTTGGYEEGKKLAQTPYDYINYEMEHGTFDMALLRAFMRGLAARA